MGRRPRTQLLSSQERNRLALEKLNLNKFDSKLKNQDKVKKVLVDNIHQEGVNHPSYYGGDTPYEVIKVLKAWAKMFGLSFSLLTAIKYLPRKGKGDKAEYIKGLRKAIWYIEDEIKDLENENS